MNFNDLKTTVKFWLTKKVWPNKYDVPVGDTYFPRIPIYPIKQWFKPCLGWVYDLFGYGLDETWKLVQKVNNGIMLCSVKLPEPKIITFAPGAIPPSKSYTHETCTLTTEGITTFDMTVPGHLQILTTVSQQGANTAIWLLQHRDHVIMPEFDILETNRNGVFFSLHDGESYDKKELFTSTKLYGNFDDYLLKQLDFIWDGKGKYTWYFEGLKVKEVNQYLHRACKAYLIVSLGVVSQDVKEVSFILNSIRFKGALASNEKMLN